jgi:hypothetical protein
MALCLIAFVFYRAANLKQAGWMLASMFGYVSATLRFRAPDLLLLIVVLVAECLAIAHWLCRNTPLDTVVARVPWWTISLALALMFLAITLSSSEPQSFLYFQY